MAFDWVLRMIERRTNLEIFCVIYYICSYIAGIPAIIKLYKTKQSNDYSIVESIVTMIGTTCWTIYIFGTDQSVIVYIGTIVDEIICLVWNGLIVKYFKFDKEDKDIDLYHEVRQAEDLVLHK